jgi:leader peptidase (prepilin peptidase)/N-methyltransferase
LSDLLIIAALFSLGIFAAFLVEILPILIFSESSLLKKSPRYIYDFCSRNLKKILDENNVIVVLVSIFILFVIYKLAGSDRRIFLIILFAWAVLILIFIDQRHYILPDIITIPMIWIGIVINTNPYTRTVGIKESLTGTIIGYLALRLIADLYYFFWKKEGLGRGDIKFIAMTGAWLGSIVLPLILLVASFFFIFWHIFFLKYKNNAAYPFGPFIGLSVIGYLIFNLYLIKSGLFIS